MARLKRQAEKATGEVFPVRFMHGPNIEDWCERGEKKPRKPYRLVAEWTSEDWFSASMAARRNWSDAVDSWAVSTGWARSDRPASNARNLARTRHPWSRQFLIDHGRAAVADWYDGLSERYPFDETEASRPLPLAHLQALYGPEAHKYDKNE